MKSIMDVALLDKRVLVRVDFNVPLTREGAIDDDARIRAALPTLQQAVDQGAKLIVASHLGRPKGKVVAALSLAPAAVRLGQLLNRPVSMTSDCVGPEVEAMIGQMKSGDVVMLENLRFHGEEEANDEAFGRALGRLCDVYINDAFAVSHRANASVVAVANHVSQKAAGLLLIKELAWFKKAMENPLRPLAAVVGGAKISSKLDALENMLRHVDKILIGGAMANTFLKYFGYDVGNSKIEEDRIDTAGEIYRRAMEMGVKFYTPVDVVAAREFEADAEHGVYTAQEIPSGWMAMDIGPATAALYSEALSNAGTILWNGPMGVFEMDAFSQGTFSMSHALAASTATTIVGGGDTGSAVLKAGDAGKMSYISTGGGAFLALMEGKTLPAVAALEGD
jgi:phosphoglycerate kinase